MANKQKSNPEKGLRTTTIEFAGKTRKLEFTHSIVGDFEADANGILRSMGAIEPGNMVFADRLMEVWIGTSKILSCALLHGLRKDDKELTLELVNDGIDAYIKSGGEKLALNQAVVLAYRYATNPSSVASLQRNWQISRDLMTSFSNAELKRMDLMEKAIADAKAKATPGTQSTDLASSNSDSVPDS